MDTNLKKILDELPDKPPRSRLEPYREFVEELRIMGRTYRDIAKILGEKCAIQVTGSGVHDFVRTRSRLKTKSAGRRSKSNPLPVSNPVAAQASLATASSQEVRRKISALKARKPAAEPGSREFEYNPDEPLQLKR